MRTSSPDNPIRPLIMFYETRLAIKDWYYFVCRFCQHLKDDGQDTTLTTAAVSSVLFSRSHINDTVSI